MNIDNMIVKALEEEFEERVKQCLANTKKHRFSLSYRLWERKMLHDLCRDQINMRWTLKRARVIVVSWITTALVLLGGTVYAVVNMGRYTFETKSEYSKLFIENLSSDKTYIEEYYGLPEEDGWLIVDYFNDEMQTVINYECEDKKVTFCQDVIRGNMNHINTEDTVIEPISLYEENDGFFVAFKGGDSGLYWIYDGYFFRILGNITKNEAVNLVYSTKIMK